MDMSLKEQRESRVSEIVHGLLLVGFLSFAAFNWHDETLIAITGGAMLELGRGRGLRLVTFNAAALLLD